MKRTFCLIIALITITGCSQQNENYDKYMEIVHCLTTETGKSYTDKDIAAVGYKTVEMMDWIARSSNQQIIKNFALDENGYQLPDKFCQTHKCQGHGYLMYKKIKADPKAYNWYRRHIYTVMPSHKNVDEINSHCDLNRENVQELAIILIQQVLLGKIFMKEFSEQYQYLEDGPKIPQ
ncbi:hypothetical protein OAO18_04680 [Francisellaceae bacterium]|nr:hypothetical protein [Francisellaceae bacterium]